MESEKRNFDALTETMTWQTMTRGLESDKVLKGRKWRKSPEMGGKKEKRGKG